MKKTNYIDVLKYIHEKYIENEPTVRSIEVSEEWALCKLNQLHRDGKCTDEERQQTEAWIKEKTIDKIESLAKATARGFRTSLNGVAEDFEKAGFAVERMMETFYVSSAKATWMVSYMRYNSSVFEAYEVKRCC